MLTDKEGVHRPTTTLTDVAFSPVGKTLATGSYDRKVKLWNIEQVAMNPARKEAQFTSALEKPDRLMTDSHTIHGQIWFLLPGPHLLRWRCIIYTHDHIGGLVQAIEQCRWRLPGLRSLATCLFEVRAGSAPTRKIRAVLRVYEFCNEVVAPTVALHNRTHCKLTT
jgi:hypothetical protein